MQHLKNAISISLVVFRSIFYEFSKADFETSRVTENLVTR